MDFYEKAEALKDRDGFKQVKEYMFEYLGACKLACQDKDGAVYSSSQGRKLRCYSDLALKYQAFGAGAS